MYIYISTYIHTYIQTDRQTDRQTDIPSCCVRKINVLSIFGRVILFIKLLHGLDILYCSVIVPKGMRYLESCKICRIHSAVGLPQVWRKKVQEAFSVWGAWVL